MRLLLFLLKGRISDGCLGIWQDEHIEGLREIVTGCHEYGAKAGIQINHAGRKCTATSLRVDKILASSPVAFDSSYRTPLEIFKEEIKEAINKFGEGAKRVYEAGFDLLKVHGAYGYLISESFSFNQ